MKFALLLYADPSAVTPEEAEAELPRWFAYDKSTREQEVLAGGEALHETDTAKTVRVRDGQRLVTDGPFAETKEILGGFYVLDLPDLDAALEWAANMPNIEYGTVEIRPVVELDSA